MLTTAVTKIDGQVIWHNSEILPTIDPHFFDVEWHRQRGGLTGSATGRGAAYFLRSGRHDLVLRPFRRGGLVGKVNAELYLNRGAERSRSYQEYRLLGWMVEHHLPVPRPVAARYAPRGLWYRADLITEYIPQSTPLANTLYDAPLTSDIWNNIGQVIRRMHDLGVHHSDLNCRNILLDADHQVWLIDFDKCWRREGEDWKSQNLSRLNRSLVKERTKLPSLFWSDSDWSALMAGYDRQD